MILREDVMPRRPRHSEELHRLQRATAVLKSIAHPVRLQIIEALRDGELTVTALYQALGLPQSTMSQQLGMMRHSGVLAARRAGNQVYYRIARPQILQLLRCVRACTGEPAVPRRGEGR